MVSTTDTVTAMPIMLPVYKLPTPDFLPQSDLASEVEMLELGDEENITIIG